MLVSTLQADADYTVVAEFAEGRAAVSAIPYLAPGRFGILGYALTILHTERAFSVNKG